MGCCLRKPHSFAAAWASHVLGVLTHSDLPPRPSRDQLSPLRFCMQNRAN
jgi:hypothetical protein